MAPPRGVGSSPRGGATGLSLGNPVFVSIHHFFMSSCVYILFSAARNRFYIGMTTLPINERIKRHNEAYYSGKFTTGADDWQLMIELPCKSVDMARELEQWIKRKKSRKYLEMLIENQSEQARLLYIYGPESPS